MPSIVDRLETTGFADGGQQAKMLFLQIYQGSKLAHAAIDGWLRGHPGQKIQIMFDTEKHSLTAPQT